MEMVVNSSGGYIWKSSALFLAGKSIEIPQPVTGTVVESVIFVLSNSNFVLPTTLTGIVSYGSLDVTAIYDNRLRVCGTDGKTRCKKAALRIFTRGNGAGFWNADDLYGAPILTKGNNIGLEVAGAYTVKSIDITNKRVVKLADFGGKLPIPISIDFNDAPYGDYSTTLIVQYLLGD
jgi:hypothetical protein